MKLNLDFMKNFVGKHGSEILIGVGIAGLIGAGIEAARRTPKACKKIEEKKAELEVDELSKWETFKVAAPCYIVPTVVAAASVGCIFGGNAVNVRRNAALATAYVISETALKDYKDKVVEVVGDKKELEIREALAKDKRAKDPVPNNIILTGNGESLCYEGFSSRYFKSDLDKINRSINELNRRMLLDGRINLNDFYEEIGLSTTKLGDETGWNIEGGFIDLHVTADIVEGEPCLIIDFINPPSFTYDMIL